MIADFHPRSDRTPIRLRRFTPADSIPEITRLLHASYRPLLEAGMRYLATHQDDATTLERCLKGETFLAERGGEIVGTITLATAERTRGTPWYDRPDVVSFRQFAVRPDLQRSGLGSFMMDLVEERARASGASEIALDTSERAEHLIRYYTRRGYRFIEYTQWNDTNYRSVILSKRL